MANQAEGLRARGSSWRSRFSFLVYGPLVRFLVVLFVAVLALVLGYIGLTKFLSDPGHAKMWGQGWKNTLFYDLQLPVLSSAPTQGPGPYPWQLDTARFLAPISTFLAAAGTLALLLSEQWRRLLVAISARHAIVAGDDSVALQVARNLRRENKKRKVVVISSSDSTLTQVRRNNHRNKLLDVRGDPADLSTLRAASVSRASELFACTSQGTVNAAIALRARDEVRQAAKRPLAAYALVRDPELGVALRARRIGVAGDPRLRLDFFAVEDIAARRLFDKHPLRLAGGGQVHVLISGFGQLGQAVLREVARRHQEVPGSAPVKVVIRHATAEEVAKVTGAFPVIGANCTITYGDAPELPGIGEYTVYVCLDDDDEGLNEGLAMAHSLVGRRGRVVVCMREDDPFAGVLADRSGLVDDVMGRLSVFGVIQEACVPANIRDDFTEQLARSIHSAYVALETSKGATPTTNPSMVPWEKLPANLRQSNIAQAADIGAKMDEIGAIVVPESAGAPAFAFTGPEIEHLAQLEHQRWMREKRADGWKYGQPRDDKRKIHPDLQDWDYLSDAAKDKDRNAVSSLPETLHAAGFQILRLPAGP
jgi:hypothetical protein